MRRLALAALLALGLAGSASAQSPTQATSLPAQPPAKDAAAPQDPGAKPATKPAGNGLRGSAPVLTPGRTATGVPEAPGIRPRAADTTLMSPGLASPAAPRLTRNFEAVVGGGGQCRTKCAQELYFCQANEGGCEDIWQKCVLACPSQSGSAP